MDAETMILPDAFTLPGILLGIIFSWLTGGWRGAGISVLSIAAAVAVILIIRGLYWLVRRREGMGLGDAKLLALIAAWLGPWKALLALFLGIVAAAIFGLLLVRKKRGKEAKYLQLPLGSFLCAAAIYAIFCGEQTIKWYLQFFR